MQQIQPSSEAIAPPRANTALSRRLCIAPMMQYSHIHARMLWRLLCPPALLYTEMIPAAAIVRHSSYGDQHDRAQSPVALQLGGCKPDEIGQAAAIGQDKGFAEINLNCGCPSNSASAGSFGACLMGKPEIAAACVAAAKAKVDIPVTVKCRIAIDNLDPESCLDEFADFVLAAGADALIVHARKAWLKGVSPKANRARPPLDHNRVARLKQRLPHVQIIANGGINTVAQAKEIQAQTDGVMIGRAAYERTLLLADLAASIGQPAKPIAIVLQIYLNYCADQLAAGAHPRRLFAPLTGLAAGKPGARAFRRALSLASSSDNSIRQISTAAAALA